MARLTKDLMKKMWPHGDDKVPGLIDGIVSTSEAVFARFGIDSDLLVAHFMAQLSHECGAGLEVVENLNYRAEQLRKQWPTHFTYAQAARMAHNQKAIANQAYNGRMGNRIGSDDGYNFRGRGGSQTTGRQGYERLAKATGLDVVNNPDLVNDPKYFLLCAVADFVECKCLAFARRDDVVGVTQHLNGGQIGIAQRKAWLVRWKSALRSSVKPVSLVSDEADYTDTEIPLTPMNRSEVESAHADAQDAAQGGDTRLQYGSTGYEVKALQNRLRELGYQPGMPDGDFGTETRAAVLAFQANSALPVTGIIDDDTKAELNTAPPRPLAEDRVNATASDLRAEGSTTVKAADNVGLIGKVAAFFGIGGAAASPISLQDVADKADQLAGMRGTVESLGGVASWAASHWWIFAAAAGVALVFYAHVIIKRRVADHAAGQNMAR